MSLFSSFPAAGWHFVAHSQEALIWWYRGEEMTESVVGLLQFDRCFNRTDMFRSIFYSKFFGLFQPQHLAMFCRETRQIRAFWGSGRFLMVFHSESLPGFIKVPKWMHFPQAICAAGPREQMNFLSSLQTSRRPFLLPSHSSGSLCSTKTNQQLFGYIKPQSLLSCN